MKKKLLVVAFMAIGTAALVVPARTFARLTRGTPESSGSLSVQDGDGRLPYLKNCRTCHGATGLPSGENKAKYPKIKALNDSSFLAHISDDSMLTVLKKGKGKDMKSWSDKLSEPEMKAVIKYVRTLPGKRG